MLLPVQFEFQMLAVQSNSPCRQEQYGMMTSSNGNIYHVTGTATPVNSPRKSQWRGALVFYLLSAWTNGWVNNRDGDDLKRHRAHYGVTVMVENIWCGSSNGRTRIRRMWFKSSLESHKFSSNPFSSKHRPGSRTECCCQCTVYMLC